MEYLSVTDMGLGRLQWDDVKEWCSVENLKEHLIVEYEDDDALIQDYAVAAWNLVETLLERPLSELVKQYEGIMPASLIHAVRLLVGRYYAEREGDSFTNTRDMSFGISALLTPFKAPTRYARKEGEQ